MKLSHWHQLRQADDVGGPESGPDMLGQEQHGHDYSSYGVNPLAPTSELPAGDPEYEQHGDLLLVLKAKDRALVVNPNQHYLVIVFTKHWWDGTQKDLGAIGREKALRMFDRSTTP